MEGLQRLAKLIIATDDQSNGNVPVDLEKLATEILSTISEFKNFRKSKDATPSLTNIDTEKAPSTITPNSEREPEQLTSLDVHEVYKVFVALFPQNETKAQEFLSILSHDIVIRGFTDINEIKNFLQKFQKANSIIFFD
jgi:hypothetical protein